MGDIAEGSESESEQPGAVVGGSGQSSQQAGQLPGEQPPAVAQGPALWNVAAAAGAWPPKPLPGPPPSDVSAPASGAAA
eukprot:6209519-Pyramimonas_sp.AAC.1